VKKHHLITAWISLIILLVATVVVQAETTGIPATDYETQAVQFVDDLGVKYGNKTVKNKARVVNNEYFTEIAFGNIPNHVPIRILGRHPALPLGTYTDFSGLGVTAIPIPGSAIAMEIVSDNVQDINTSGTGAWQVKVYGLGAGYIEQSETVDLNGTTAVDLASTYLRINHLVVVATGSGGFTAGTITLRADGAGTAYSNIVAGDNLSRQGLFTVPADKTALILSWAGGVIGKESEIQLLANHDPMSTNGMQDAFVEHDARISKDTSQFVRYVLPIKIPEKTDIKIRGQVTSGTAGIATTRVELFYED